MPVKQAMHKGVRWVDPDTPIVELTRALREHDIGAVPVGENDRFVGMVTEKDNVCPGVAAGLDPLTHRARRARDVMTAGILFCLERHELEEAARLMQNWRVRRLPVINANKRMTGILSRGGLYKAAPRTVSKEAIQAVSAHHK